MVCGSLLFFVFLFALVILNIHPHERLSISLDACVLSTSQFYFRANNVHSSVLAPYLIPFFAIRFFIFFLFFILFSPSYLVVLVPIRSDNRHFECSSLYLRTHGELKGQESERLYGESILRTVSLFALSYLKIKSQGRRNMRSSFCHKESEENLIMFIEKACSSFTSKKIPRLLSKGFGRGLK